MGEKSEMLRRAVAERICLDGSHDHGTTHCGTCDKRTPSVGWLMSTWAGMNGEINRLRARLSEVEKELANSDRAGEKYWRDEAMKLSKLRDAAEAENSDLEKVIKPLRIAHAKADDAWGKALLENQSLQSENRNLAAVVERMRKLLSAVGSRNYCNASNCKPERAAYYEKWENGLSHYCEKHKTKKSKPTLLTIALSESPAAALNRVKAKIWDEAIKELSLFPDEHSGGEGCKDCDLIRLIKTRLEARAKRLRESGE